MTKSLSEYNRKRNFNITAEPAGGKVTKKSAAQSLSFVIQKHDARRLHYDFRLELDGTLKSWAIPKGPSLDPKDKRLAVHVEDHPLSYASFEGNIPHGQYGGGDVIVWDQGVWQPHGDPRDAYQSGKLKFTLVGEKLAGDWTLVRTHLRGSGDKEQWLLIKERDDSARPAEEYDIVEAQPQSVITGELLPNHSGKSGKTKGALKSLETTKASAKKSTARVKASASKTEVRLPDFLAPELATLVNEPPSGDWLYEVKFDGYRILARIEGGEVKLITRNNNDWTEKLPLQAKAIAELDLGDSWLDGEVVVLDEKGLPDFQALQNAFDIGRSNQIIYYLFDAPILNGEDLRELPVEERRARLEKVIPNNKKSLLRFSGGFMAHHETVLASACAMSLEGVIGKRMGSPYVSRRSGDWIKLKCRLRQEFVIVGYTSPQGSRSGFGALLLGVHSELGKPELRYAGRVGTGFNEARLQELYGKMSKLARDTSPLSHKLTSAQARDVHWIEPELVCEVEFAQWTSEGILRQAAFFALRTDKPARDIIREQAKSPEQLPPPEKNKNMVDKPVAAKKSSTGKPLINSVAISHPDRVIDPESGATKEDLALFYSAVADWILPHLDDRPVSLVRAPDGITGEQFFQKHADRLAIPNIKQLDKSLDPGHPALMEIDRPKALIGAIQMGTVELHTWGASAKKIEFPDRITLDLDPDPALPWRSVVEATRLTLAVLDELELNAWLKTTGGKGIHIVVPLAPVADWEYVKEFSKQIAQFMARQIPERFVARMGPKNRVGKIFIDYLRNQRGASAVSAFSVRARPGLPVSVPITRDELLELHSSNQWTIANLHERLASLKSDPWADYFSKEAQKQRITQSMWKMLAPTI